MKKILLTAAAVFVTLSIYAQGTIDFKNDTTSLIRNGNNGGALVTSADGIRVALYWAPLSNPDNFTVLVPSLVVGAVPPVPGQFFGGTRTTGTETLAGTTGRFIVKAWEAAYGATFEEAVANTSMGRPALRAESPVFTLSTGNPGGSPPIPAANLQGTLAAPGFTGLTVMVPEPSMIALGLLGAGSLLLFRRRK